MVLEADDAWRGSREGSGMSSNLHPALVADARRAAAVLAAKTAKASS